jgi:hypothetical protein
MYELNAANQLISEEQDCLETELPVAKVEEILETWSEELHDHDIVLALCAIVLDQGYAHSALHNLVKLALHVQLRVLGLGVLKLHRHFLVGCHVCGKVDVTK